MKFNGFNNDFSKTLQKSGMSLVSPHSNFTLLEAVSLSQHRTPMYASKLQQKITELVLARHLKSQNRLIEKEKVQWLQAFLRDPSAEQFEGLNLELASEWLLAQIKLFFFKEDVLTCISFGVKTSFPSLRIFKKGVGQFTALAKDSAKADIKQLHKISKSFPVNKVQEVTSNVHVKVGSSASISRDEALSNSDESSLPIPLSQSLVHSRELPKPAIRDSLMAQRVVHGGPSTNHVSKMAFMEMEQLFTARSKVLPIKAKVVYTDGTFQIRSRLAYQIK